LKTIVVAGANGFLGNKLVAEALKRGAKVHGLARDNHKGTARDRVMAELNENLSEHEIKALAGNLVVHHYDIAKNDLGLGKALVTELRHVTDTVFNCVGDTNFFPKNIEELYATNIEGVMNLIKTLCDKNVLFNHVSTAYVCGDRNGVILENELDEDQGFKNPYEQSKFLGEKRVREVCEKKGIRYNIFRPSIVIRKHSVHGKIPNLNHFYSFVGLIDILRQDAQTEGYISTKDKVKIDVRFLGSKQSTLNFVDLDYVVTAMIEITQRVKTGCGTYHLVNHEPMTNQQFLEAVMAIYRIEGFQIIEDKAAFSELNFRERLIKRGLANYVEYFYVDPRFNEKNVRAALKGSGIACPKFDQEYIARATGHLA
jgi:2-alkyl-3-oxoalkanoate reductase